MNKQIKKVGNKYLLLIVLGIAFCYSFTLGQVSAADELSDSCKESAEKYYNVTSSTLEESTSKITLNAKNGVYDVTVTNDLNEVTKYNLTAGTKLDIPIVVGRLYRIEAVTNTAYTGGKCNIKSYTWKSMVENYGEDDVYTVENSNYTGVCRDFREFVSTQDSSAQEFYRKQKVYTYCTSQNYEYNYDKNTLSTLIENIKEIYRLKLETNSGNTKLPDYSNIEKVEYANIGTSKSLVCDIWSKDNSDGSYSDKNTHSYWTEHTEENKGVEGCNLTCVEKVTVKYGAPVATKAGMCFEYKVKIYSKTDCQAIYTKEEPKPSDYPVCRPIPRCNNYAGYEDQGGPSDDFDSCVQSCDGGKYSQKCINKCYKKVYGTSNTKSTPSVSSLALNYTTKPSITKINQQNGKQTGGTCPSLYASPGEVYDYVNNYGTGYFTWTGNGVIWNAGSSCYWDRAADYYFSPNKYQRTVLNVQGYSYGGFAGIKSEGGYILEGGFKKAEACHDNCYFSTYNCAVSKDGNMYFNQEAADQAYTKAWNEWANNKKICESQVDCYKRTSTYEIKSYVDRKGTSNDKWYSWTNQNTSDKTGPQTGGIIIDNGGICFGKTDNTGTFEYMTEISYPGSYKNNKTGEVTYTAPSSDKLNGYTYKEHEFCVPLDQENVNKLWWYYAVYLKKDPTKLTEAQKSNIINEIDTSQPNINKKENSNTNWNIYSDISNFGYYGWNFNISCFYAVDNNDGAGNENPECDGSTSECPPTAGAAEDTVLNYKFRSVDNNNMFPTAATTGDTSKIGYNWSASATNINNENYPITPTALITKINERAESLYSNESEYLDYHIVLTPKDIAEIKKYNRSGSGKVNSYTTYEEGTFRVEETGVKSYYSNFITPYIANNTRGAIGCNNQSKSGRNSGCEPMYEDQYVKAILEAKGVK